MKKMATHDLEFEAAGDAHNANQTMQYDTVDCMQRSAQGAVCCGDCYAMCLQSGAAMPETTHRLATNFMQGKEVRSVHRMVKSRLYFTSESHMYAMLNVLRSVY